MEKRLTVIGLGYIGLPTSVVFADNDWQVTGVDNNLQIVDRLNKGQVHITENGLEDALKRVVNKGKFIASQVPTSADVFIIAVPTPLNLDKTANLSIVMDAVNSILPVLEKGNTIILESTVPPGTTRNIVSPLIESEGFVVGKDIYLSYCPERVLPGNILVELVGNNRITGGINKISAKKAADAYRSFVQGEVIESVAESAELSKLMENTYRDVNIALANELAQISEKLNIDALEVIKLANEHPRVNIHQPGPGVGGHCIAVDPYFILEKEQENTDLIKSARSKNEWMPKYIQQQVDKILSSSAKVAIFGLAFKGNVDDIRNSPSLEVRELLLRKGHNVVVYDPYIRQEQVDFKLSSFSEAIKNSQLIIVLTDHDEFKYMDSNIIKKEMSVPNILDTKNCMRNIDTEVNYYSYSNLYELKYIKI